ncbi:MAG TPA: xanthine dehydrogenase family protein molybdopterin-binding subunit [Candidatus Deferrimicrobiaceae bacterium]|nr:xanthine dehydrogenase family protein molybdopterin-binding subunit [Candidatus Deferrimicrobiaceae bacterium]
MIGVARSRPDAPEKVRGAIRYGADRPIPGLLHARLVLAGRAHARIRGLDAAEALAIPGVVAVLTAADLAIAPGADRMTMPLARDEVIFAGQPVALVVAESAAAAADAVELVLVDLEPLPVVLDPEAAMRPDAPLVRTDAAVDGPSLDAQDHAAVGGDAGAEMPDERLSTNVVGRVRYADGDCGAAFARADVVVEGHFTSSWTYQGYLEPQTCTARLDDNGALVVETATQSAFSNQSTVAKALKIPSRRIRVVPTPLGGAFGGKWEMFETLVAAAALRLGRPVRLTLTRLEDLAATNPSQGVTSDVRVAADQDGRLLALDARLVADTGAFEEAAIHSFLAFLLAGPYAWPAYDIRTSGVRTNRFGGGAYRGPGGPPMAFAIETLLDEMAARLALDPIELRRRNLVGVGDSMLDGEPWPRIGAGEVLDGLAASPLWQARGDVPSGEGVGVALGYWPGATGPAAAACRVSADGSVQVVTGIVDMSGVAGGFQALVAEVIGIDPSLVEIVTVDTDSAPPSPGSGGSQITYSAGRAIRAAAEDVRQQLLDAAAHEFEIGLDDLELADGQVRPKGTPDRAMSIAKLVRANQRAGRTPIEGHGRTPAGDLAPQIAGHVVHVRVDTDTGEVAIVADHVVQDVGRALNPALIRDQQLGGAMQGIGWALLERLVHDEDGGLATGSLLDYALPRARDAGRFETTIVEVPAPDGPFGARGMAEGPVIAGPAAVASAIAAATGLRLRDLPMSAPRVWRALLERAP